MRANVRRYWVAYLIATVGVTAALVGIATGALSPQAEQTAKVTGWAYSQFAGGDEPSPTTAAPERTPLEQAKFDNARYNDFVTVSEDGKTLTAQTTDEYGEGIELYTLDAILLALETPDAVIFQMEQTRALDGMQSASWDGYSAQWTYHPDNGFAIVIEAAK